MREANLWESGLPQGIAVLSNLLSQEQFKLKTALQLNPTTRASSQLKARFDRNVWDN